LNFIRPYAVCGLTAVCLLINTSAFVRADTPAGDPPLREQSSSETTSTAKKQTSKRGATAKPTAKSAASAKKPVLLTRYSTRGAALAQTALAYRGAPYRFGGRSAQTGFDCSGLVQAVCAKWGIYVPRAAHAQYSAGTPVPANSLEPGDLVFFKNTYKRGLSHVGIYIGDRKFLHAAGVRYGVMVSSLDDAYHRNHYVGARRMDVSKLPPVPGEEGMPQRVLLDDGKGDAPDAHPAELPIR
jgi:cell wall-associated NlpC family hydrolase